MKDISLIQSIRIPVDLIDNNDGQIEGVKANPREMTDTEFKKLKKSLKRDPEFTALSELKVYPYKGRWVTIGGNMRLRAIRELGWAEVIAKPIPKDTDIETLNRWILLDNANFGKWDFDRLANEWEETLLADMNISVPSEYDEEDAKREEEEKELGTLVRDFIIPPLSVLDSRSQRWIERKRKWKELGLSGVGRDEELTYSATCVTPAELRLCHRYAEEHGVSITYAATELRKQGKLGRSTPTTSIFDPVLCEIIYRWFNVKHGRILDPFAGGAVRGIVAGALQMPYFGNDLRTEQIESNERTFLKLPIGAVRDDYKPTWTTGDSLRIREIMGDERFDMLFSCPPYADLEKYSDDPNDLSNMPYENFIKTYREIIAESCHLLKDNRFAVFVVGDVRDKKGVYRNFVGDTIEAFRAAGMKYYAHLALIVPLPSGTIRARACFRGRKICKQHQDVIVALKGKVPPPNEFEKIDTKEILKQFEEMRIPEECVENVAVFFKGNPNNIKTEYSSTAIQSPLDEYFADENTESKTE